MADNTRLYVGNLPYVAQQADVEKLFADNGFRVSKVDMSTDPFTGRNPSYCFVDFDNSSDANRAMETLQGQEIGGRAIRINPKTDKRNGQRRPETKSYDRGWRQQQSAPAPATDGNENAYVFDRWSRNDASSHWTAPVEESRRLWVSGLPQISGQEKLNTEMRELFKDWEIQAVSKIISPNPEKHPEPESHYYCFVDFATPQEANDAAEALNGAQRAYGGTYKIRIARNRPQKVEREQLGGAKRERRTEAPPKTRNLEGSWRRVDT